MLVILTTLIFYTIISVNALEQPIDIEGEGNRSPASKVAPAPFQNSDIERTLENGKVQKFDGNKYKIVPRGKKGKRAPAIVPHKYRVSLLAGRGPLGNIREEETDVHTDQDFILGLQGMADISGVESDISTHVLLQVQTNKSALIGIGVGF